MARNFSTSNHHDFAAERADEWLATYDAVMSGEDLDEGPRTLRHRPDDLRQAMSSLLTDLMCLAAAQGLEWDEMLQAANHTYEVESQEEGFQKDKQSNEGGQN